MDKAESDPVADAQHAVALAKETVAGLIAKRAEAVSAGLALAGQRKALSYKAHAQSDKTSARKLAELHQRVSVHASELASLDDALAEAREHLKRAEANHRREIEKQRAQQALDHLETLVQACQGADSALRQYSDAILAIDRAAQRVAAVTGGPPGRPIVAAAIRSAHQSVLINHARLLELPVVPPASRRPLAAWGEAWATSIRLTLHRRIEGEPEQSNDTEEAA